MDTAVLVISLVLGFSLVLMFIYRLGIEERFDRAAVSCLVGGLALLGMATLGRINVPQAEAKAATQSVQQRMAGFDLVANRLDAQLGVAINTASQALTVATEAKDQAAIKPSILSLDTKITAVRAELARQPKPSVAKPSKRKSAWTLRMEARVRDLERQVRALKQKG